MCKLWTNFAKYQNPTPNHDNPLAIKWDPIQPSDRNLDLDYLIINDETRMARNINAQRINFWRSVYAKWNKSFTTAKL